MPLTYSIELIYIVFIIMYILSVNAVKSVIVSLYLAFLRFASCLKGNRFVRDRR